MNLGLDNKKKTIQAAVAGSVALVGVIYLLWFFLSGTTPPPPQSKEPVITTTSVTDTHAPAPTPAPAPAAVPAGKSVAPIAYSAAQLDPTLHPEGMLEAEALVYSGTGRNIFSMQSAPPPIPKVIAPARPSAAAMAAMVPQGPPPPPPPPPIDLKFFGTEVKKDGSKRAFLLHGEDVFLAGPGDIVDRRYKIHTIMPNGIVIEDLPNNNKQTIPLSQ
ncbi:MAG TPA: hypothetical protein VGB94_04605 [Acidobacteriaceae bacterium]